MDNKKEIINILSLLEESVDKEAEQLNESRFGRVIAKFTDYTSKVISNLKRSGVDESSELNLSLILMCYNQGLNSRDCAAHYMKSLKTQ